MFYRNMLVLAIPAIVLLFAGDPSQGAQPQSSRPIRVIVPFAPGGQVDLIARLVSEKLSQRLKTPVIVDNRPGAGGLIGTEIARGASPDGHTLLMGSSSSLAILPSVGKTQSYDPLKDFSALSLISSSPYVLVVGAKFPASSVADLIALAKSKPGQLAYGSAGAFTGTHLATELFGIVTGTRLLHVPYKGSGPATIALLGGEISFLFNNLLPSIPHIKSGRFRALAVTSARRNPILPDVPTVIEAGIPNYESGAWNGLVMPAHGKKSVVKMLNAEIVSLLKAPDVQSTFDANGSEVIGSTPEAFRTFIQSELVKWSDVIRQIRVKQTGS